MKIYSKFHDYYDSARALSYSSDDNQAYYIRNSIARVCPDPELKFKGNDIYANLDRSTITFGIRVIGFCGILFTAIQYRGRNFYSFDSVMNYIQKNYSDLFKVINSASEYKHIAKKMLRNSYKEAVESVDDLSPTLLKIFEQEQVPAFMLKREGYHASLLELNPILKDYEFYKVFPPALAYQELEMYFNSVLVRDKPLPVQITDDIVKLEAKGFDKRISFRHRA